MLCTTCARIPYCMYSSHFLIPCFCYYVIFFFQCMGVHYLVNHTRNALIMVLYCMFIYFCTALISYVFAFFFLCYFSYVFFFKFRFMHCFVGYVKTSFDRVCTALIHNLHCMRPVCILYYNFITSKLS